MAEHPIAAVTREAQIAALAPLAEGSESRYVYNRMDTPWEGMFGGRPYILQPHDVRVLKAEIAEHLYYRQSQIPGTLRRLPGGGGTLTMEKALALGPGWKIAGTVKVEDAYFLTYTEAEPDPEFLVPTDTKPGLDYFDRSSIPNYVERPDARNATGQAGQPTHAAIMRV